MPNHPSQTRKLMCVGGVGILALVYTTLALAVPAAAAECRTYKMQAPDPNTLKLKDGEHVVASVGTVAGKLEARVTVKGNDVSDPRLFLGGKPLKDITESQIRKEVRECMQKETGALPSESWLAEAARGGELLKEIPVSQPPESIDGCLQTAALSSGSWIADAARSILDWIVPPAYAAQRCMWNYTTTCTLMPDLQWSCTTKACCTTTGFCRWSGM